MTEPLNWDEFRIVKAIADTHSLAGAGARLGLNHSTMFRRLTALEGRLGVRLFERERGGYRPTAAGDDMIALATVMGHTIQEFERRIAGDEVEISGIVRVTTLNSLGCVALPGAVTKLAQKYPNLHVETLLTETSLDLFGGEADIAIRCLKTEPPPGLTGRRACGMQWAIYAAEALIARQADFDLASAPWIVPSDSFGPPQAHRWIERHVAPWRRVASANSDLAMLALAAQGVGAALLPAYLAASQPHLRRVGDADADLACGVWLLAHPQTLRTPRVRLTFEFLSEALESQRSIFEGETRAAA